MKSQIVWLALGMGLLQAACGSDASNSEPAGSGGSSSPQSSGSGGRTTSTSTSTKGAGGASSSGSGGARPTGSGGASSTGSGGSSAGAGGSSASASTGAGGATKGSGGSGGTSGAGGATIGSGGRSGGAGGSTAGSGGASSAGSGGSSAGAGGSTGSTSKFVGNITARNAVPTDFYKYWNQITPENEGKWGSVQSNGSSSWNWSPLDKIYSDAKTHNYPVKAHNFVWGSQQPSWVTTSNAETAVKAWMKAYCDRFPDTPYIDVVNEPPPHTKPSYSGGMGGDGTSGYDWIVNAFKWARDACPNSILILNDYNNIEYSTDNSHFIDIVTKIKAAGAPIDAIGAQAHDAYKLSTSTVKGFIDKLADTGLPIYISEYDIDLADDTQQSNVMQEQFTMFYTHPSIKGITVWGYISGETWKTNTGLMSSSGTMRPAMKWLMQYLGRQ